MLAGAQDICIPPRYGRVVAEGIPGVPDEFNARVDAFWREVEARA